MMNEQALSSIRQVRRTGGFTLIELLIVIAIVGILAGLGYPSYSAYVVKSKRSDGHLALLAAVQSLERCKSTQFSYANCTISAQETNSPEKHYTVALNPAPTANTFTIVATPGATQIDSECTSMTIDHLGNRTSKPGADGTDENGCWN